MEARISGMAGRRNRGSWWWNRERKSVPERAERRGGVRREGVRRRRGAMAGPRSWGRLMRMC